MIAARAGSVVWPEHGNPRRLDFRAHRYMFVFAVSAVVLCLIPSATGGPVSVSFRPPFATAHPYIKVLSEGKSGYGSNLTQIRNSSVNVTNGRVVFGERLWVHSRPNKGANVWFLGGIGFSRFNFTVPSSGGNFSVDATWITRIYLNMSSNVSGGGSWYAGAAVGIRLRLVYATNGSVAGNVAAPLLGWGLYDKSLVEVANNSSVRLGFPLHVPPRTAGTPFELDTWIFVRAQVTSLNPCATKCGSEWVTIEFGQPGYLTALSQVRVF